MTKENRNYLLVWILSVLVVIGILLGCNWYSASVKASVWRRQGVDITTWEVFVGATPVERKLID